MNNIPAPICVTAPGTCGELAQGIHAGRNFLVTCPIDWYSIATVSYERPAIAPGAKTKQAVANTLHYLNYTGRPFYIEIKSTLPQGKGMASSSADISAAIQAAALTAGRLLTPDEIAAIATAVEPTDGIFFPGIVMFDHCDGRRWQLLGAPPPMLIAMFDMGGQIDTVIFNQRPDLAQLHCANERRTAQALTFIRQGLQIGSAALIGRGATLSALANQAVLYKPDLARIIAIARRYQAVGVNVAHSGTLIGVLFDAAVQSGYQQCIEAVQQACPQASFIKTARLIGGGLTIAGGGAID